jgi:hypothetical protein
MTYQREFDRRLNVAVVLENGRYTDWLANGVHPLSLMLCAGGRVEAVYCHPAQHGGGAVVLDISADFEMSGPVGLAVACAPDGSEQTRITYDPQAKRLIVDRSHSSLGQGNETFPHKAPHERIPAPAHPARWLGA